MPRACVLPFQGVLCREQFSSQIVIQGKSLPAKTIADAHPCSPICRHQYCVSRRGSSNVVATRPRPWVEKGCLMSMTFLSPRMARRAIQIPCLFRGACRSRNRAAMFLLDRWKLPECSRPLARTAVRTSRAEPNHRHGPRRAYYGQSPGCMRHSPGLPIGPFSRIQDLLHGSAAFHWQYGFSVCTGPFTSHLTAAASPCNLRPAAICS